MEKSKYTYPFQAEIFRQGLQAEIEKTKAIIERKASIIHSIEKEDAQLTPRQYAYCETLRSEGKQLISLIESADNLSNSFISNLTELAEKNQKLEVIVQAQESQIQVLQFILSRKREVALGT